MEMAFATWKALRIMLLMLLLPEFARRLAITLSSDYQMMRINSRKVCGGGLDKARITQRSLNKII